MKLKIYKYTFGAESILLFMLFSFVMYFPVLYDLDRLPISLWDESLFSLRALYMHINGEYMYNFNFYEGLPDHANTKLPFTTWIQVLFLKIMGISILSIRLPIALIFIFTAFYMVSHFKSRFGSARSGYVFGLVAITSIGFIEPHLLRSGDQDAPFACYMLLAAISFVSYLETDKKWSLVGFTFFSIAALLTKNLLAGLLAPGILLFVLFTKQLKRVMLDYKFWMAALTILGVYAGMIYYYEVQLPGFVDRMWNYELMGRYTNAIENHDKPAFFYVRYLALEKFVPYFFLLPIVIALAFIQGTSQKMKNSIFCVGAVLFCYLFILSFSKTQTFWYIAPIYLLGSYLIALASVSLFNHLRHQSKQNRRIIITSLFFGWVLLYGFVISNNLTAEPQRKDEKYGMFIESLAQTHPDIKKFSIVDSNFGTSAVFYKEMFNRSDLGYEIDYQRHIDYRDNQLVMTCLNNVLNPTQKKYYYNDVARWNECILIRIQAKK